MTDRSEWEGRVGRKWAEEWRRTDRSFAGLTDRLLGRASSGSPRSILDVGCGAGELSLAFARGHPPSHVVGVDVSQSLIEIAHDRGESLPNVSFELADAAEWEKDRFTPDLVMSRHGVMFFPDPVAAFAHIAQISAGGARLVFSCFRERAANPWASDIAALVGKPAEPEPPFAPGPFAFADSVRVESILADAGWRDIAFEPVDFAYVAGAGEEPMEDALSYFLSIGPAARAAADLSPVERASFVERLEAYLSQARSGDIVALGAAAWIVTARLD